MTPLGTVWAQNANDGALYLFGLANAGTGAAHNVVVTFSITTDNASGGSLSFTGAATTTAAAFGTFQSNFGSGQSPSLGFTTTSASTQLAVFEVDGGGDLTGMTGGTERFITNGGSAGYCGSIIGGNAAGTGGTVTITITNNAANSNAIGGVEVLPPSSGAAPYFGSKTPVRARIPAWIRHGGVYMGMGPQSPPDTSFGTGQVQWNAGAPVQNPRPGPVFYPAVRPVRAPIPQNRPGGVFGGLGPRPGNADTSFGTGRVMWCAGAPVQNPAPGPVFYPKRTPVRFILPPPHPRAGRVGSSFGAPAENPAHGPPAYPLQGPVRARIPQLQPRAGRVASSPGAPVRNPAPGPVFTQKTAPVQARKPLPARGRVYVTAKPAIAAVPSPAPFFPATSPIRAKLPQQPFLRGRMASLWGAPVQNPAPGPVFTQAASPARMRASLPPRGRIYSSVLVKAVAVPQSAPFFPRVTALRAKFPQQPLLRGRSASNAGAPVRNPAPGPVFRPAASPARARIPQAFSKGRVSSNPGAIPAVIVQQVSFPLRSPVQAKLPLPRRGACRSIKFSPPVANPQPGPVFQQAASPVRARFPLPPRGRIASNPGVAVAPAPVTKFLSRTTPARGRITPPPRGRVGSNPGAPLRNPQPGPVFTRKTSPARAHPGLPSRGRIAFNAGAPVSAVPATGPVFYPRNQARAQLPLPRRGICRAIRFYPVQVNPVPPVTPAPLYPLQKPVRAPLPPLQPRAGRVYSNPGAPVSNPASGPPILAAGQPAGMRVIFLAAGRAQSTPQVRVASTGPVTGPVFIQKTSPARIRPSLPPRGRVSFNKGAPLRNPNAGPVFYPAVHPAQARIPQVFSKGRVYSNPGGPVLNPAVPPPVYPLKSPVRIHPQLPPRGRSSGNPGVVVPPPHPGPAVYPAKGPVTARRPLPPHGRVTLGNPGAAVRNPQPGPVFRQATSPARTRIPQNAPRGRTASNPGGPVENIPFGTVVFRYGTPYFEWDTGTPYFEWETGEPYLS